MVGWEWGKPEALLMRAAVRSDLEPPGCCPACQHVLHCSAAALRLSEPPCWCPLFAFIQVGDRITGGDIYGIVHENSLMDHKVSRAWAIFASGGF